MSHFDDFFRANYLRMVNYCASFGYTPADIEEEVSSVILRHYDEYKEKIEGPNQDRVLRSWLNRRVLLNMKSNNLRTENAKKTYLPDDYDMAHIDDPEALLDLKQRIPDVPDILINYEQHAKEAGIKLTNTSTKASTFCRARKKFMSALQGVASQ